MEHVVFGLHDIVIARKVEELLLPKVLLWNLVKVIYLIRVLYALPSHCTPKPK